MSNSLNSSKQTTKDNISQFIVFLLALGCAVTVANLYYIQPLLADIASDFNILPANVGFVAMLTQVGYALGILLITPLSDLIEKKKLITIMLCFCIISLLLMFISSNIFMVGVASFAIGLSSIVPQLIIPLAAQLASPNERGKTLGTVTGGLLIGILLSRTFSGVLGSFIGWRKVYLLAAIIILLLGLVFIKKLPYNKSYSNLNYRELIKSMPIIIKENPILIEASLNGGIMFAAFSTLWSSLIFFMESDIYRMGSREAGLMGLVGIAGALVAPIIGRIADKKSPKFLVGVGLLITVFSYIIFFVLGSHLLGLVIGVILIDLGVQICLVSNQARIHAISESKRSRINAIFMFTYFIGGSIGTFSGTYCFQHFGWYGVCTFGIIILFFGFVIHINRLYSSKTILTSKV